MSICTQNNCRKPAQSAGLCLPHWYQKRERERTAWRTDPDLCYQCGQKRDDHRKACASCRAKENRRRKKQRQKPRAAENRKNRAQRRQSEMQQLGAAERTLNNLLSPKPDPAPDPAPRKQAPAPDLADLLSSLAGALDTPHQAQDPPQDSGPQAWERRPDESAQAYRAFLVYLHLGLDRSLQKAYRSFKGSDTAKLPGRWRTWCLQHEWVARAAAYDSHQHQRLDQDALQEEREARKARARAEKQADAQRRAAVSNAARRAYRQNQRRWHDEGRLCRGRTRAGAACKRPAVPGEHYCPTHTRQALHDLARGDVYYFKANLPHTDKDFVQIGPKDVSLPEQAPPDDAALLWFPLTKERLPARLLYAHDCPAALRTAIRIFAQKMARRVGVRLRIEPTPRHPQNR